MTATLVLKLFLVPSLIYAITLAGRRWGPGIAGWLSAFPVVAGPILIAVALEHGAAFAATAAEGTLVAVIATLVFCIAYAWSSGSFGVAGSLACALAAYAVAVAVLQATELSAVLGSVVVVCALAVAPRMFPRLKTTVPGGRGSGDVIWRMLGAAALVLVVTYSAASLGPRLSGIFAMFPVMGTVLTGFTHAQQGRVQAIATLRGMVLGYWAFAAFCLVVSQLLRHTTVAIAFTTAFICALGVQLGIKQLQVVRRSRI